MSQKEAIYILIPVHNRQELTIACLKALEHCDLLEGYHILVIDDGSTDGTVEAIVALYPEIIVLQGYGHLWWTGAIRKGMEYAYEQGAELFVWLNDDCQVALGSIPSLVEFCREHPGAISGSQGVNADDSTHIAFGGKIKTWRGYRFIHPPVGQVTPCDLLSGNLVCIPRTVVDQIGYPDPDITPHYGGDSLYLIRAQKAGFRLFVDTRYPVLNSTSDESRLYPNNWVLCEGDPLKIFRLVFVPQSGLSWRVWLRLNWETYSYWGLIMFCKKYVSIVLITVLRFLPYTLRIKGLHFFKRL